MAYTHSPEIYFLPWIDSWKSATTKVSTHHWYRGTCKEILLGLAKMILFAGLGRRDQTEVVFNVSVLLQARTPADSAAIGVRSNWWFLLYLPSLPIHVASCHVFHTEDFFNCSFALVFIPSKYFLHPYTGNQGKSPFLCKFRNCFSSFLCANRKKRL